MIKLKKIVNEIILEKSYNDDFDYELDDIKLSMTNDIFSDFLYKNNDDMTKHIPWQLISFPRLKKIWEDFVKVGHVRDDRGFEQIENIIQNNTIKLWILTELAGHTEFNPDEIFEEKFGIYLDSYIKYIKSKNIDPNQYQMNFDKKGKSLKPSLPKINVNKVNNIYLDSIMSEFDFDNFNYDDLKKELYEKLLDKFAYHYSVDPKTGSDYLSDYGLNPLLSGLSQLRGSNSLEEKLPIIDQMLNVVHQRSDLAGWFVEGGSRALSNLSGMEVAA